MSSHKLRNMRYGGLCIALLLFVTLSFQVASQGTSQGDAKVPEKTAEGEAVEVIIQEKTNEIERLRSLMNKERVQACPADVLRKLEQAYGAEAKKLPENPKCYQFRGWGVVVEKVPGVCEKDTKCSTDKPATIELPGPVQYEAPAGDPSGDPKAPNGTPSGPAGSLAFVNNVGDTCYCFQCLQAGCGWYKAPSCSVPSSHWCIGGYFGGRCEGNRTLCTVNGVYMCCLP